MKADGFLDLCESISAKNYLRFASVAVAVGIGRAGFDSGNADGLGVGLVVLGGAGLYQP